MSGSNTKQEIIKAHRANDLLLSPYHPTMQRADARDLSVDQPTKKPDPVVAESAAVAMEQGNTHYVDVPGIAPLRDAFADYLAGMGVDSYESANVLVSAGVQESRFLTIQKIGEQFDSIALPAVVHPGARKALGVRPMELHTIAVDPATMLPTLEGIKEVLAEGCRLLYFESPSRLTGAVLDDGSVSQIAELLVQHDAAAIWDQGLAPWVAPEAGDYVSLGAKAGMAERVALLGEGWPGAGLESWFIGYIAAKADWLEPMRSQKQIQAICTSTASQFAAVKVAEMYPSLHAEQLSSLATEKGKALAVAGNLGGQLLSGDVVNLIALRGLDTASVVATLKEKNYLVTDGSDFGAPGLLRLSVTGDGAVVEALQELG
jgi:aspartate/methionine/tyrosine aminotransferase